MFVHDTACRVHRSGEAIRTNGGIHREIDPALSREARSQSIDAANAADRANAFYSPIKPVYDYRTGMVRWALDL